MIDALASRYADGMTINSDSYELDDKGNRVLIGLTVEETREFARLEVIIAADHPLAQISSDEWRSPNEKRWLALYEKHRVASEPFLRTGKTKH